MPCPTWRATACAGGSVRWCGCARASPYLPTPWPAPSQAQPQLAAPELELHSRLMLKAMIQAAKCDGKLDDAEKKKLLGNLGDATQQEMAFVQQELNAPVDVDGLVRMVPNGLGPQVYMMSVMAIDLDNRAEAQYLHALAQGLGLNQQVVNQIHSRMGVPALYS